MSVRMPERQSNPRPERKPSAAGLRAGGLMRGGDAKHRRAARLTTTANQQLLERAGYARARFARKRRTKTRAKARLSLGLKIAAQQHEPEWQQCRQRDV